MGGRFARLDARQYPDLTPAPWEAGLWPRRLLLALLTFDGVLSAAVGALFLPLYLGSVPFPISAIVSGALNAALAWAALQWAESPRVAAAPLWAFLATVLVLTFGGPGGDAVFQGPGAMGAFRPLFFIVAGAGPAAAVLWRRQRDVIATTTVTSMSGRRG